MTPERIASALRDRYRLERELGAGGMATVFLAEDLKHDRKVAIKVLKPELAAVLGAERFVQEIKTTAALSHPHILPLFDSGEADGFLYYVMPYIEGETIREKLNRETQFGIEEAVTITTEVADALDYAHRHGVIHRDIKPENILLHDGRPMVMDFGIALAVSAAAGGRMTETGLSLGTPHYMSPEQATADKAITARSDVYSLASVLYEMLTGEPPHTGSSAQQIIMKIVTDVPRPVTELRRSVPPNVSAAILTALEKLPADRFESARAFAHALRDTAFTIPAMAGPLSGSGSRRNITIAQAAIIGALGIGLGVAGVRVASRSAAPGTVFERQQLTFEGHATSPGISPDGAKVAYERFVCEGGAREASFESSTAGSRCRSSLVVQEVGATRSTVLMRDLRWMDAPRWTVDGQSVIVSARIDSSRAGLFLIPLLTGTARLIASVGGVYDTHPTADSAVLVSSRSRESSLVRILELGTGAVSDSFPLGLGEPEAVAWSPDGRWLAIVAHKESGLYGLSLVGRHGEITGTFASRVRPTVRWSPDGRSVLLFRVGTVREDELIRVGVDRAGRLAPAADVILPRVSTLYRGRFDIARRSGAMALGTGDALTNLHVVDFDRSPPLARRVATGTTWYGFPILNADGSAIYVLRGDAAGDNAYRIDVVTGEQEALTAQDRPGDQQLRLSADGRRLVSGRDVGDSARIDVMELPAGRVRSTIALSGGPFVIPLGSAGLLIQRPDGALAFADSLGGAWTNIPLPDSITVSGFDASSDGRRVAIVGMTGARWLVLASGLTGTDQRVLLAIPAGEPQPGITWTQGDTVYVSRWLEADASPSLWRVLASGGTAVRVSSLTVWCRPSTVHVSLRARRAVCQEADDRADVWVYRLPGLGR